MDMTIFKKIAQSNTISLFLLVLPYFIYNWLDLYNSPFFDFFKLIELIISLLIVDFLLQLSVIRFKEHVLIPKIIIFIVVIFL